MKKTLMLAAASVACAALPAVGVFATDVTTMTDTINITISQTCTFDAGSHSYTKSDAVANTLYTLGTTTMKVTCNKYNGYSVVGVMNSLSANSGSNTIACSTTTATAGSGTYSATVTGRVNGTEQTAANKCGTSGSKAAIMSRTSNTASGGETSTIVYKVGTGANQAAGTYSGTVVYTLTAAS